MKTPHKHAEVIKAWADGEQIQWQDALGNWRNVNEQFPIWWPEAAFRVKPETIRYRVALMRDCMGDYMVCYTACFNSQESADVAASSRMFIRWITDWIDVEI